MMPWRVRERQSAAAIPQLIAHPLRWFAAVQLGDIYDPECEAATNIGERCDVPARFL